MIDKEAEGWMGLIREILGEFSGSVAISAAVYEEFVRPLVERAESAERLLVKLSLYPDEPAPLHETVVPPRHPGGQHAGTPKQECSCGMEWASSMSLFKHQADALRAEVVNLDKLLIAHLNMTDLERETVRRHREGAQETITTLSDTVVRLQASGVEQDEMLTRCAGQLMEAGSRIREQQGELRDAKQKILEMKES